MSKKDQELVKQLDRKLSPDYRKKLTIGAVVMIIAVLMHDSDHIRQALNWHYSIPMSLWVLNITVYILPVVSLFLARMERYSTTIVSGIAGIFTSASFLIIHLFGSASGLWGVWNYSYFELIKGVTYQGVFYQGVDFISWIFLFEVPVLCLPVSVLSFKYAKELKGEKQKSGAGTTV